MSLDFTFAYADEQIKDIQTIEIIRWKNKK